MLSLEALVLEGGYISHKVAFSSPPRVRSLPVSGYGGWEHFSHILYMSQSGISPEELAQEIAKPMTRKTVIIKHSHPWDLDPPAAIVLQCELAPSVIRKTTFDAITAVAGIDASYREGLARAAVVVSATPTSTSSNTPSPNAPSTSPTCPACSASAKRPRCWMLSRSSLSRLTC